MKAYAGSINALGLIAIPHGDMWYFVENRDDGFRIFREPRCIFNLNMVEVDQRDAISVADKIDNLYEVYPLPQDISTADARNTLMREILLDTMQTFGNYFKAQPKNKNRLWFKNWS